MEHLGQIKKHIAKVNAAQAHNYSRFTYFEAMRDGFPVGIVAAQS